MNKDKVYIEGYEVGFSVGTIGNREKKIQVSSGEIVSIDENFIYKSIEPKPVKVPQFVADWIERSKQEKRNLRNALNNGGEKIRLWFLDQENYDLFARAWLDGYEVEKEKRYLVKIRATKHYIAKDGTGKIFFSLAYKESFTKKELEDAGFGWVFNCEGIEIEEVEE